MKICSPGWSCFWGYAKDKWLPHMLVKQVYKCTEKIMLLYSLQ
jgi:hypothetical protein